MKTALVGKLLNTNRVVGEGKTHYEPVSLWGQAAGVFVVRVGSGQRTLRGKIVLTR